MGWPHTRAEVRDKACVPASEGPSPQGEEVTPSPRWGRLELPEQRTTDQGLTGGCKAKVKVSAGWCLPRPLSSVCTRLSPCVLTWSSPCRSVLISSLTLDEDPPL